MSGRNVLVLGLLALSCGRAADNTWRQADGYRWRALDVPRRGTPGFTLLDSSRTGISFVNTVSESLLVRNRILAQGGGVCFGDVDGDGLVDIFLARTEGPNALYRNLGGWRFADIAQSAGVRAPDRYATGCAFADVDGDGDLDLILTALGGPNALFLNDGTGHFTEQGEAAGLTSSAGSTTIAVADVDGDGWLDLYIANYKAYTTLDRMSPQERSFDHVVRQLGPGRFAVREQYRRDYRLVDRADLRGISLEQRADPDFFYRNAGGGRFIREPIARNPRFVDEPGHAPAQDPNPDAYRGAQPARAGRTPPSGAAEHPATEPGRRNLRGGRAARRGRGLRVVVVHPIPRRGSRRVGGHPDRHRQRVGPDGWRHPARPPQPAPRERLAAQTVRGPAPAAPRR